MPAQQLPGWPSTWRPDALHRQIQALSAGLCELQTLGRNSEALARLGELHNLRDTLLEQMKVSDSEN
jgi:hypothetical protein